MSKPRTPVAYIVDQLYNAIRKYGFRKWEIWGSLYPAEFDSIKDVSKPSRGSDFPEMAVADLLDKLRIGESAEQSTAEAVAEFLDADVLRSDSALARALRLTVKADFTSANSAPDAHGAEEVYSKMIETSGVNFLWDASFKYNFSQMLLESFECPSSKVDSFLNEYDTLVTRPMRQGGVPMSELDFDAQLRRVEQNVLLQIQLLFIAAFVGPARYFGILGLPSPSGTVTPDYESFVPPATSPSSEVRLQPVVMTGFGVLDYYTDSSSDCIDLDARNAPYRFGRDPEPGEDGTAVQIASPLKNVSRQHAELSFDRDDGWIISDSGSDGGGSSWGTLVISAGTGPVLYGAGLKATLRHGDIICFGPRPCEALEEYDALPHLGVRQLCYRFEITRMQMDR